MHLSQIYETRLIHLESRKSIWALIVPARSFRAKSGHNLGLLAISKLGLKKVISIRPSNLPFLIASMLVSEDQGSTDYRIRECVKAVNGQTQSLLETPEFEFAEQIAFSNIIPFEHSPLSQDSLASLVSVSTTGKQAASASLVRTQSEVETENETPLLLVSHPKGLVICGAGPGVQNALRQGLWDKILEFLQGKPKPKKK
jgi:hypothetical protein